VYSKGTFNRIKMAKFSNPHQFFAKGQIFFNYLTDPPHFIPLFLRATYPSQIGFVLIVAITPFSLQQVSVLFLKREKFSTAALIISSGLRNTSVLSMAAEEFGGEDRDEEITKNES
jgi:hypothetical protein